MRRAWPSLIAAAVDLIDGRRWNLTPDQVRRALLLVPPNNRGIFELVMRKVDPTHAAAMGRRRPRVARPARQRQNPDRGHQRCNWRRSVIAGRCCRSIAIPIWHQ
jgi:hypothetical protein